ncbi:formimidoylglutamase [Marinobacter sp. F3R08]|uniref:formimidoylglutamase n=1 Tax=Marinobacter sp. F3R08 TaxID=2841559 RepID=UPI001C09AF5B|nr:formimidoylglutamase [Marinobacter sp. F3R08]MBU2953528.1 formimidoylglutamase [Marinobacter sp. F3R08]
MTFKPAQKWEGRIDKEENPDAIRWHQKVSSSPTAGVGSTVGLLGFACDAGVRRNKGRLGAAAGPYALRRQLANLAWYGDDDLSVQDFGTVEVAGDALEPGQEELASKVADTLPLVRRLLVVGGGHETAWGSFSGLARVFDPTTTRIGIINLDAHFDLRMTGEQGPSSGTPFAQIAEQFGREAFHYCCLGLARTSNTRSLFGRADELGVSYREDRDMRVSDIPEVLEQIRDFCQGMDMLYLTIDLDVLPHYQAPGVSAPAARGVALEVIDAVIDEVEHLARSLPQGMPLVEISELNPEFDESGVTAKTAALLADALLCPNRRP